MYVKVIDPHVDDSQATIPRSSTFSSEHGINCLIRPVHLVLCSFGRSPLLKHSVTQLGDRPCAMTVFHDAISMNGFACVESKNSHSIVCASSYHSYDGFNNREGQTKLQGHRGTLRDLVEQKHQEQIASFCISHCHNIHSLMIVG
ncbi:hypothetical protein CY34DRAFT_701162 [Suillus luteus UH-Slu-Lm8-n1]|uniref:Uncharacterized protein n=1 Tax=Suillus luteus UH-Slu-Lm8-n1 TaxID=930992 RepID=A0A0D0ANC5_9AGAM|nr:hypothetical protein CY34DRAFT_701162 [Suillus luteus UH-Slu-Lm8-n1]